MKKFVSICLILLCAVLAVSCGSAKKTEESDESAENVYLEMAEEYVNKGDFDAAADILQKGIDKTGSKALSEELKNVLEKQAKAGEKSDSDTQDSVKENGEATDVANVPAISKEELMGYNGSYYEMAPMYTDGELWVSVDVSEVLKLEVDYYKTDYEYVAEFTHTARLSDMVGNTVTFDYLDSLGNEGKAVVTFSDSSLTCEFEGEENATSAWYIRDGIYNLSYFYTGIRADDFEYDPDYEPVQYDMNKASGILASMGMTEEQFRNACSPLSDGFIFRYDSTQATSMPSIDRYHLLRGKQYFTEHPEEVDVQEVLDEWNEIVEDYESGGNRFEKRAQIGMVSHDYHLFEKYGTFDNYINDTIYACKGENLLENESKQIFAGMREYPKNYVGKPYVFVGFDFQESNTYVYTDDYFLSTTVKIEDLRDDVHDPNLLGENDYYFYTIFDSTFVDYDGDIGLKFLLLSAEKILE